MFINGVKNETYAECIRRFLSTDPYWEKKEKKYKEPAYAYYSKHQLWIHFRRGLSNKTVPDRNGLENIYEFRNEYLLRAIWLQAWAEFCYIQRIAPSAQSGGSIARPFYTIWRYKI